MATTEPPPLLPLVTSTRPPAAYRHVTRASADVIAREESRASPRNSPPTESSSDLSLDSLDLHVQATVKHLRQSYPRQVQDSQAHKTTPASKRSLDIARPPLLASKPHWDSTLKSRRVNAGSPNKDENFNIKTENHKHPSADRGQLKKTPIDERPTVPDYEPRLAPATSKHHHGGSTSQPMEGITHASMTSATLVYAETSHPDSAILYPGSVHPPPPDAQGFVPLSLAPSPRGGQLLGPSFVGHHAVNPDTSPMPSTSPLGVIHVVSPTSYPPYSLPVSSLPPSVSYVPLLGGTAMAVPPLPQMQGSAYPSQGITIVHQPPPPHAFVYPS